jgi:hypothetical protein
MPFRTSRRAFAAALAASAATPAAQAATPRHLDLDTGWGNLEGYLKARSDIGGAVSMSWTSGVVWSMIPGRKAQALMLGHGVNVTRCLKDATGYVFLQRECLIWSDLASGTPLSTWFNPYTERTVEVFHIENDSVSSHYDAEGPKGPYRMRYMENTGDVTFYNDLFYATPSPLNVEDYPAYVASSVYEGAGLYHFHVKRADLDNPGVTAAPMTSSHTGIRQWLPWMEMGAWTGQLVLPSRGKKLANGAADLPRPLRTWMEKNLPRYLGAPTVEQKDERRSFYGEFRKHIDAKRAAAKQN